MPDPTPSPQTPPSTPEATPPPVGDPAAAPPPAWQQPLQQLTENVNRLVEAQGRPAPQAAPARPEPPALEDVPAEEFQRAMQEGDWGKYHTLSERQRRIDADRIRRETSQQMQQGYQQLSQVNRRVVLNSNELYRTDPIIRQQTDAFLDSLLSQGYPLDAQLIEASLSKVIGDNHNRLLDQAREAERRQMSESAPITPTPQRGGTQRPQANDSAPGVRTYEDLGPESRMALQCLNNGRGKTLDEFARDLPPRTVRERVPDPSHPDGYRFRTRQERYRDWAHYEEVGAAAREKLAEQQQRYFGPNGRV